MTGRLAIVGILWSVTLTAADEPSRSARQSRELTEQVDQLVRQLDDDSYSIRELASTRLREIGEPALGALRKATTSQSFEVEYRARALIEYLQRSKLYTISRDGRLFRIEVGKNQMKTVLLAKLGEPFEKPNVRVEGLAMAPSGMFYACTVFESRTGTLSSLYRVDSRTGVATAIGEIAATEIDGLVFGADGRLYGAISSGAKAHSVGLRQIVSIDTETGQASSTVTEITFCDLDALAFSPTGLAFVTNGCKGLYSVNPKRKNQLAGVLTDFQFRNFLCDHDDMEGMCIASDGAVYGLCHEKRSFLVRVDTESGRVTKLGDLGFAALCLTALKSSENVENETSFGNRSDQ